MDWKGSESNQCLAVIPSLDHPSLCLNGSHYVERGLMKSTTVFHLS